MRTLQEEWASPNWKMASPLRHFGNWDFELHDALSLPQTQTPETHIFPVSFVPHIVPSQVQMPSSPQVVSHGGHDLVSHFSHLPIFELHLDPSFDMRQSGLSPHIHFPVLRSHVLDDPEKQMTPVDDAGQGFLHCKRKKHRRIPNILFDFIFYWIQAGSDVNSYLAYSVSITHWIEIWTRRFHAINCRYTDASCLDTVSHT